MSLWSFITHTAREGDILKALEAINANDFIKSDTVLLRIEE